MTRSVACVWFAGACMALTPIGTADAQVGRQDATTSSRGMLQKTMPPMTAPASRYEPVAFAALPGWAADDHLAAFHAFARSCQRLVAIAGRRGATADPTTVDRVREMLPLCQATLATAPLISSAAHARQFFETRFVAQRVVHAGPPGLLTGYYEPVIKGARAASPRFSEPIYRRPPDLVNVVAETQRGAAGAQFTHLRKTTSGTVPYFTRADIDAGALKGQNLELFYLPDPVEVFFLQVQGSGIVELPDGKQVRVAYDGKNGHPYTSIGRVLIDTGVIDANRMSLEALGAWLRSDLPRARSIMHQNRSYVFFRELTGPEAAAPLGVLEIPLTAGRSLAVDVSHHAIGLPVYVTSSELTHATGKGGFHRLMVAQDVGSAIRGPERGDIYFGSGPDAGKRAGITKHPGNFFVLTPRTEPTAAERPTSALPAAPSRKP